MDFTAFSKLNLFLRITGKREDGYHLLESVFLPLTEPSDRISIDFDASGEIRVDGGEDSPSGKDNICYQAAEAVCSELNLPRGMTVVIRKNIPVAAGMGGGSSDAAAVINGIQTFYNRKLDNPVALAEKIGADVPFFLNPRPALVTGIGEKSEYLTGLKIPPLLIVAPEFPVRAAWSYRHRVETEDKREASSLISALREGDFETAGKFLRNDLAEAVRQKFPVIGMTEAALRDAGACGVQITGSGPTIYGIFPSEVQRASANRILSDFAVEHGFRLFAP